MEAMVARTRTPLENTNRSPRLRNWRGISLWRARIADSRGKSWYAVLAARNKIPAVKTWSTQNPIPPLKAARPIWEMTVP